MTDMNRKLILPFLAILLGLAVILRFGGKAEEKSTPSPLPPGTEEIQWKQLIPQDWNPRATLDRLGVDQFKDNDPKAKQIMAKIRAEWDQAPAVSALDGKRVRITGYVVTLEGDENGATEFLLVPFYGSCIHTPPPPANQVVHVLTSKPIPAAVMFNQVRVTGKITVVQAKTGLASAGYQMRDADVEEAP